VAALVGWLGVFAVGVLGNVPGQDLMQRIFAARSDRVARWSCLIAGCAYLLFGMIPLMLALAANLLFPADVQTAILPAMAHAFLSPPVAVVFLIALLSAILSTIDSAILSPASVLSQNVLSKFVRGDPLKWNRFSVLLVALCSLLVAYCGETAYSLLEDAYALTMVGLFVPLMIGLYTRPRRPWAGIGSMLVGTAVWGVHWVCGWEWFLQPLDPPARWHLPVSLSATGCSLLAYLSLEPPWRMERTQCHNRCNAADRRRFDNTD
jgi:solute:Na+ symporter, SSS family